MAPLSRDLQEQVKCNNERDFDHGDASMASMDVPVIDLALLMKSSSLPSSKQELEKLRSALTSCGCFQVINHGIEESFLKEMREVGLQFFGLPDEEKRKYSKEKGSNNCHGYKDDLISEHQTPEWACRMNILVTPEDQRLLKFWPQSPPNFSKTLHEYGVTTGLLSEKILKAMARSLNLEENSFVEMQGERSRNIARFNFYPPRPSPNTDQVLGFKPHTDGSVITILLPDKDVEGLQYFNDNKWKKATILPQALLVNIGDQGQIMSNGIFKSPTHRVVTNPTQERISVAMCFVPNSDKEIEPVGGCVSDGRPVLYKKLKDYDNFYFQHYWRGQMPIEAAMV